MIKIMFNMGSWDLIMVFYGMLNDGFNEISYDFLWDLMGCFILDKVMFAHPSTTGFIKKWTL